MANSIFHVHRSRENKLKINYWGLRDYFYLFPLAIKRIMLTILSFFFYRVCSEWEFVKSPVSRVHSVKMGINYKDFDLFVLIKIIDTVFECKTDPYTLLLVPILPIQSAY